MKPHIYFWEPQVQRFIDLNNRILKIYEDTKVDKDTLWEKYKLEADEKIKNTSTNFNPEYHDYSDLADLWNDLLRDYAEILGHAIAGHLYQYLTILCQTWENQLISFCIKEIKSYGYTFSKHPEYKDIIEIIRKNIDNEDIIGFKDVRELRLLINVIKHGEGQAAKRLRKKRPDFFKLNSSECLDKFNDRLNIYDSVFLDGEALNVNEEDLYKYHEAITDFWKSMPERVYFDI